MSSIHISIPKISIYWFRAHKNTIVPGRITILIFLFSMVSESNLRNHLLFAPQTQFETLFKTLIYLLGASRNLWKFFEFQNLKITFSSLSALQWRFVNFYLHGFQKLKNPNHLLDDSRKSEISRKKHPKKIHKCQKVIEDKVPIFVGGVKFLAIWTVNWKLYRNVPKHSESTQVVSGNFWDKIRSIYFSSFIEDFLANSTFFHQLMAWYF